MAGVAMKTRVKAWGHPTKPDLDYVTDNPNADLRWREYPYVDFAVLTAIDRKAINDALSSDYWTTNLWGIG